MAVVYRGVSEERRRVILREVAEILRVLESKGAVEAERLAHSYGYTVFRAYPGRLFLQKNLIVVHARYGNGEAEVEIASLVIPSYSR